MKDRALYEQISERLKGLIDQRYGLDFNQVETQHYNVSLLDPIFSFSASDLLYLFFDVELEFKIHITQEEIGKNQFSSFDSIAGIIEKHLMEDSGGIMIPENEFIV